MSEKIDHLAIAVSQLEEALDNIRSPQQVQSFLSHAAQFWRYSASNIVLLCAQAEKRGMSLSLVAGVQEWKREGRYPSKGSTSLKLFAPSAKKYYSFTVNDGTTSERKATTRKTDIPAAATDLEENSGPIRFRIAHVFDVSQTTGAPIDAFSPAPLVGEFRPKILVEDLTSLLTESGFRVEFSSEQHGLSSGYTNFDSKKVVVGAWLPENEQAAVLAHEYAHTLLHGPDDPLGAKYSHGTEFRSLAEVEAEATAFLILHAHGIDSTERSAQYLAGWSNAVREATPALSKNDHVAKRSDVVRSVLSRICTSAKTVLSSTSPVSPGGKPAHLHAELDQQLSVAISAIESTGPVVAPTTPTITSSLRGFS